MTTRTTARRQNNDAALAALVSAKMQIDAALAKLVALSDDHFGATPDRANWGDVGSANYALEKLNDILQHYGPVSALPTIKLDWKLEWHEEAEDARFYVQRGE